MNMKRPHKGRRFRHDFQEPIRAPTYPQVDFLNRIVDWLDHWESLKHDAERLTLETQSALRHTSHAFVELAKYCLEELGFRNLLLRKL